MSEHSASCDAANAEAASTAAAYKLAPSPVSRTAYVMALAAVRMAHLACDTETGDLG